MMTEMGGIIGLIPPSEEVLTFCRERTGRDNLAVIQADPDAEYTQEIDIDISGWWLAPRSTRSLSGLAPMAALRISRPSQRWSKAKRSRQAWSPRLCLPHARCMPRCSKAVCSTRCSTRALSSATPAAVAVPRDTSAWLARARFRSRPATGTLPASRVLVTTTWPVQ